MKVARKPDETLNRRRAGQFMETTLRLFLLVFVAAAVVSPPDPLLFVVLLIPGWIAGVVAAFLLVYRTRRRWLADSGFYEPGRLAGRRPSLWFAGTAILAKLAVLALFAVASIQPGPLGGIVFGVLALALAYVLVYQRGYEHLGVVR